MRSSLSAFGSPRARAWALAAAIALGACSSADAQIFGRPPADVPEAPHAQGGDAAGLAVRIERLEGQTRALTGQVEQLQNQNRRLEDQLKRFQQDVEFRFQEQAGGGRKPPSGQIAPAPSSPSSPGRRGDATAPGGPMAAPGGEPTVIAAPVPAPAGNPAPPINPAIKVDPGTLGPFAGKPGAGPAAGAPARAGRGDAFDPTRAPDAPGAPKPLGAQPPSAPLQSGVPAIPPPPIAILDEDGASAPLDLSNPKAARGDPRVIAAPVGAPGGPSPETPAAAPSSPYDLALADYRAGRYDAAEQGFRVFVEKNPRDRRVPDAIFYRGETYLQRHQQADAAQQYLNVATNYSTSARAPEALVRLGVALVGMGEREQACATFGQVQQKHPGASNAVRAADREMKRNKC
jgi:tol-pal system protein YbgF